MNNPDTTAGTKPSTMETIKGKAAQVVNKIKGNDHTAATTTNTDPALHDQPGVLHTGDRATYDQQPQQQRNRPATGVAGANTTTTTTDPALHHQPGVLHTGDRAAYNQQQQLKQPATGVAGTTTTTTTDPALHNQPGVLHTGDRAAYDQQLNQPTTGLGHAVPTGTTGTTGTSHIPTYAQNIPPMAAGVVPTAYAAEDQGTHNQSKHHFGREGVATAEGAAVAEGIHHHHHHHQEKERERELAQAQERQAAAVGTNTAMHQQPGAAGILPQHQQVHNEAAALATGGAPMGGTTTTTIHKPAGFAQTVPAMGQPGTTTAAGTHMPGTTTTAGTQMPGQYNAGANRPI